ncbi:type II secretion system protein [Turicibacter sp. TJ11]|uniref:type II secretion system protein n=1 Tax=Turicibacter sp. TJ11 TaxID=2806443 RepID=UPI001F250E83|nr:type II secretion system protein [Turicibacter sp. TJ11]
MENNLQKRTKKPGLTLIEVIISVALLAILSIPIFITVNTSVKLSQKTELSQQATVVGQRILEYLGSVNHITLSDSTVLNSVGLELAFSKDSESNMFVAHGKTKQEFDITIELKNLIQNDLDEDSGSSSNDLMKNPQFIITENNNRLVVNNSVLLNQHKLTIDSQLVAQICSDEMSCIESAYNEGLAIEVKGEINNNYEISVENQSNQSVKIYIQFEENQPKNIKFKREKGQVEVSYLTKMPALELGDGELTVESMNDLYEIEVIITSDKVDGALFKGNTVSSLNIYEKE